MTSFITKGEASRLLSLMLASGADFAEIFLENTHLSTIEEVDGIVRHARARIVRGAALRVLCGGNEYRSICSSHDIETLESLARDLAKRVPERQSSLRPEDFKESLPLKTITCTRDASSVTKEEKKALLSRATEAIRRAAQEKEFKDLSTITATLSESSHEILITSSEGVYQREFRPYTRLCVSMAAGRGDDRQTFMHDIGGAKGFEIFSDVDWHDFALKLVTSLMTVYQAPEMSGGKYDVVIGPGFGGVILHEACVHGLEATSLVAHATVFEGKLGQKIANDCVSAVDDGTIPGSWGSLNIDDEGHAPQRNVLIEHGVLKSYLIDKRSSRILGLPATGSGRRENYMYPVTSRMTNTFFLPGTETLSSLIKDIKLGFYAREMGGGSVNPATSEFNFAVREGYMIRDGKIAEARRGATLVGRGAEVLLAIDGIARDDLSLANGVCGSLSGSVPTTVGEPSIRVRGMTVGGKEMK